MFSKKSFWINPLIGSLALLLLSACAGNAPTTPTPTQISVDAIYTAAAQTLVAQMTATAQAQPTATFTAEPSATQALPTLAATAGIMIPPTPTTGIIIYYTPVPVITVSGTPATVTATPTATQIAWGCNNAQLVSDLGPANGSALNPGNKFRKTWRITNNGTCDWLADFKFTFVGGDVMNSDTFKIRRTVAPGEVTDIFINFVAPTAPGTHTGYWRMQTNDGHLFGVTFVVQIVIPGATYTPTKTATVTETPTKTATSGPSNTPSNTSVPATNTFTPTTVPPTNTPEPPTNTPEPPTNTPEPPTATPTP